MQDLTPKDALLAHARQRGLGLHAIGPDHRRQPAPPGLLLGYAGLSAKQLRAAAVVLGKCLDEVAEPAAPEALCHVPAQLR